MSEFTGQGVITKTLDEWYEAVVAFKREVWGQDFVTDPTTKQGADILQLAELLYNAEMNNVSAFGQLNLNTAEGICLDYIGFVRGIRRNGGRPQEITVDLTSSITGWYLTPDVIFKTTSGYTYYCPSSTEITSLQQQVTLIYSSDGNPDVSDGDPLQTVQPNTNVVSAVIAENGVVEGADTESDTLYRKRIKDADVGFVGTLELMTSEMATIQGLAKLKILSNDEATTDSRGIPAYCTEFLVVPDDTTDGTSFDRLVAQKIVEIKEPGAPLYGTNRNIQVLNYYGENKNIKFTRPTKVEVEFFARIGVNQDNVIDTSSVDVEKQAIVDYVQAVDVGESISWSRILGMIAGDTGYTIIDWGLRKVGASQWVKTDISCDTRQYLWIELSDIEISATAGL